MRKLLEKCPACGDNVVVTRQSCTQCDCEISGRFQPTIFNRLSPESLAFVETFVRLRGNIKEMERELGVPYNAVRSRLDEVIAELGFTPENPPEAPPEPLANEASTSRQEILAQLERGEINASKAVGLIADLNE